MGETTQSDDPGGSAVFQPALPGLGGSVSYSREAPLPPPGELAEYQAISPDFPNRAFELSEGIVETQNAAMTRLTSADAFAARAGAVTWPALSLLGLILGFAGGVLFDEPWAFTLLVLPGIEGVQRLIERRR